MEIFINHQTQGTDLFFVVIFILYSVNHNYYNIIYNLHSLIKSFIFFNINLKVIQDFKEDLKYHRIYNSKAIQKMQIMQFVQCIASGKDRKKKIDNS